MMKGKRQVLTGLVCALAVAGLAWPVDAQSKDEKKRQKELQEALQREARPVLIVTDQQQRAQGAGDAQVFIVNPKENDLTKAVTPGAAVDAKAVTFRHDMMKAADGKVYVPYTVEFPASAFTSPVSVYIRVVPKGELPPAPDKKDGRYTFEDYYTTEPKPGTGPSARITRAFAAPPGEYDVYFGLRARAADAKKSKDEPVSVLMFKPTASLPNFWSGDLTTSTIVVTSKVDTIQGQVSPEAQRERPYLFGQTEFVPSPDNKFKKTDELSVVFQIYNPALDAGKPNVQIDYTFHARQAEGEKYFNKTNAQQLNGQTLPPNFDVAVTQMLPGGQSVPLGSFPPGDYRMEIKVTDNVAKKTITRDVLFSVLGG